jgi:hypothetical protein
MKLGNWSVKTTEFLPAMYVDHPRVDAEALSTNFVRLWACGGALSRYKFDSTAGLPGASRDLRVHQAVNQIDSLPESPASVNLDQTDVNSATRC